MQWGNSGAGDSSLQPQPLLNANKIVLLSTPAPESAPPAAAAPAVCMEWGDFSGDEATRAGAALAALKPGDALTQRQAEHVIGYWVYLAPAKTAAGVRKHTAQLKALGVQDYSVIQSDDKWRNAISLGVFKTQKAAEDYQKTLTAKGVKSVEMGERTGKRAFTVFALKNPDAALTAKITALSRDYPGSEFKSAPCGN
jgi:hypothetical protein